jgi:NADH-quinone oxidoreductase subunit J
VPLDDVVFWVFAPIAIAAAVGMLVTRSVVYAALFLVVNFGCIAVMYLVLDAAFLFAVQIIVYAGAIMVLFLFVIMLLGVDRIDVRSERLWLQRPIAIVLAVGFVLEVATALRAGIGFSTHAPDGFNLLQPAGNTQAVAQALFQNYFFPFEATSILLIVAAIAAMVLAQRKVRAVTQAELGEELADEPQDEAEVEVAP